MVCYHPSYSILVYAIVLIGSATSHISLVDCWVSSEVVSRSSVAFRSTSSLLLDSSSNDDNGNDDDDGVVDFKDKDVYQRVFYRFADSSADVLPKYNALVVEEIVRFEAVSSDKIQPVGRRTLLLRDGDVEDGEIGDILFRLEVREGTDHHNGAGLDRSMEATIGMILYLAANPSILEANVLELSCGLGLGTLLGSIAANTLEQREQQQQTTTESSSVLQDDDHDDDDDDNDETDEKENENNNASASEDILTIPKQSSLPGQMKMLFLSDPDEQRLNLAFQNVQASKLPGSCVSLGKLNWSQKSPTKSRGKEYHTIIGCNLDMTFLEAKELARTVAHRLEPSSTYHTTKENSYVTLPAFLNFAPDYESSKTLQDLIRFLEKGYNMNVATDYIKLEKIMFRVQTLDRGQPELLLDEEELEVQEYKDTIYKTLIAYHSPDYDSGMGEYFFPMETGTFGNDSGAGSSNTYLEPDPSGSGPF